jgi:hypothetical protein
VVNPPPDTHRQTLTPDQVPFEGLRLGFERAARLGVRAFDVELAGYPVRIRVAGQGWSTAVPASIGHLISAAGTAFEPALTIDVWDVDETGVGTLPAADVDCGAPPILMKTSDDGRYVGEERHHGMTRLDRDQNRIIGFTRTASQLNLDERARPFHKLLSAWLEDRGVQFVHAGLITHAGKGILFVGSGGAGKSTSLISCLRA